MLGGTLRNDNAFQYIDFNEASGRSEHRKTASVLKGTCGFEKRSDEPIVH